MSTNDAFHAVIGHVMIKSEFYQVLPAEGADFTIDTLPIKKVEGKTQSLTAYVEIITDVPEPTLPDMTDNINALPAPFQCPPEGQMQIYTSPSGLGKVTVVKLVSFSIRCSLTIIKNHVVGELCSLKVGNHAANKLQMAIHYIGRRLGGPSLTNLFIEPNKGGAALRTPEELKKGFDFIREMGPLGSDDNQNIEWAESSS